MKNILRNRNKLVKMAVSLKGEELKAVEFSIKLIDFILDLSNQNEEGQKYIFINGDILYLNDIETYFITN